MSGREISLLVLFKELTDALFICSRELGNLSAVFVNFEGGHGLYASCLGNLCCLVNVDLAEGPSFVFWFCRNVDENGSNALTGWAPGCREVDNHGFARRGGVCNKSVERVQVLNVVHVSYRGVLFLFSSHVLSWRFLIGTHFLFLHLACWRFSPWPWPWSWCRCLPADWSGTSWRSSPWSYVFVLHSR